MKFILATLALLICLQFDASAQKRSSHYGKHHRSHKTHHRKVFYRSHNKTEQPSAYKGDNTPINDGQKKNVKRNLNYNSGQPLPSNNGR